MLFRRRHHLRPHTTLRGLLRLLGPGLITGASDDDPSGIATYSQAGAQFGFAMSWLMLFSWPLMAVMMLMTMRREVMGQFTLPRPLWVFGWLSTAAMALAVAIMFATWSG